MESAEALGPPHTAKADHVSDSCADRVAQAGERLKEAKYEEALCLLLGDEDNDEHSVALDGSLSKREHLGMVVGTLGAAVPAMVAEVRIDLRCLNGGCNATNLKTSCCDANVGVRGSRHASAYGLRDR